MWPINCRWPNVSLYSPGEIRSVFAVLRAIQLGLEVVFSAKPFAGLLGHTGFKLTPESGVVEITADQHYFVHPFAGPVAVINREAFAGEVENMAALTFVEPENALCPKHI